MPGKTVETIPKQPILMNVNLRLAAVTSMVPIILTLSGCDPAGRCDDKAVPTVEYKISAEDSATVPYTGFDTLRFLRNKKDTLELVGGGWKRTYTEEPKIANCLERYDRNQRDEATFHEINGKSPNLIVKKVGREGTSAIGFSYDAYNWSAAPESLRNPPYFTDSIKIFNKSYRNVEGILNGRLLYTVKNGIIRIVTPIDSIEYIGR